MNFKKEYLLILLVIIGLSVYIYTRNTDRMNYELPEIPPIERGKVSRIVIEKPDGTIVLTKKEQGWVAGEREYPARAHSVEQLLTVLDAFSLIDLVALSKNYARYALNPEAAIQVRAWAGQEEIRSFRVGKSASTYRNAYVKIEDDPFIYLSGTNLKSTFDKDLAHFQDKTVLSFDRTRLTEMTLHGPGRELALYRKDQAAEPGESNATAAPTPDTGLTTAGQGMDPTRVRALTEALVDLKCAAYLQDRTKADFQDPDYRVVLQGAERSELNLFVESQDTNATEYRGTSLENDFPFTLAQYKGDAILEALDALLVPEE